MSSSWLEQSIPSTNTYVIDAESATEQARLIDQETLLTEAMGGPPPEQSAQALEHIHDVLDIGCGPGGWVHTVAQTYPQTQATGIDVSTTMITYAQAIAHVMRLGNAHFCVMDATRPLDFPDASFDLVNARLVSGFLLSEQWPLLLAECTRMLRPGGIVRLTEGEWGIITAAAPATARLFALGLDAMYRAGRSFSFDSRYHAITAMLRQFLRQAGFHDLCYKGYAFIPPSLQEIAALFARWRPDVGGSVQSYKHRHLGITPMLGSWFYQTGYQQVQQIPTAIEVSAGTQAHPCFTLQVETFIRQITPFLLAMRVVTEEAYERLCVQVKAEVQQDTFCGLCFMLSVFGQRPGSENAAPL